MAPYLILSDIHGNYEALEAVLEDARGRYDRILCLGDLVGYGADPNQVTEWAKSNVASVVRGNHDRACTGTDSLEYFNPVRAGLGTLDPRRAHARQFGTIWSTLPGPAARDAQRRGWRFRSGARLASGRGRVSGGRGGCSVPGRIPGNEAHVLRTHAPAGRLPAGPAEREAHLIGRTGRMCNWNRTITT